MKKLFYLILFISLCLLGSGPLSSGPITGSGSVTIETDPIVGGINGIVYADGVGNIAAAIAGNFPILNQNTTGNAATSTTATTANALATNATGTNLSLGGVVNVTGLATLSGGSTYGTPVTHSASENATAATHYGQTHIITGAYTVTIPALSVGQKAQYCSTTAAVFSLDSTSPNYWKLAGTNTDAGDKLTSDGSSGCMYFEVTDSNTLMLIWSTLNLTDGGA